MTTEELRAKLQEHSALPPDLSGDGLMAHIDWTNANPPPSIRLICWECGKHYKDFQLTWDDVAKELELKGSLAEEIQGCCPKHASEDDEDAEE